MSRALSTIEKEKINRELIENLRKRNKYKYLDTHDDGLNDIENLFGISDDYYKPILSQTSFDDNYQRYTCRGDKDKKLSFNEYMDIVKPYIITLLNDTNKKETRKIQLDIRITTENILKLMIKETLLFEVIILYYYILMILLNLLKILLNL